MFLFPKNSPSRNAGVCWHLLLQGISLTQGWNLGLPYCRQILFHLRYQGNLLMYIHKHTYYIIYILTYWDVTLQCLLVSPVQEVNQLCRYIYPLLINLPLTSPLIWDTRVRYDWSGLAHTYTPIFTYLVSENKSNFDLLALQTVEKYLAMSESFRNHAIKEKPYIMNVWAAQGIFWGWFRYILFVSSGLIYNQTTQFDVGTLEKKKMGLGVKHN